MHAGAMSLDELAEGEVVAMPGAGDEMGVCVRHHVVLRQISYRYEAEDGVMRTMAAISDDQRGVRAAWST